MSETCALTEKVIELCSVKYVPVKEGIDFAK